MTSNPAGDNDDEIQQPGFELQLLPGAFRKTEQGWHAPVLDSVPVTGDSMDDVDCSTLWLFEDDLPLGPPHAAHQDIVERGAGRFSHWRRELWFSTSDGSDPDTNGRRYAVAWEKPEIALSTGLVNRSNPVLDMLGDVLRSRGVDRLSYFHTDHFEPFDYGLSRSDWAKALRRFAHLTARSRFAGRLSLFYTPLLVPRPVTAPSATAKGLRFDYPNDGHFGFCREFVRPLEAELGHEFHVHLHHETWTASNYLLAEFAGAARCDGDAGCDSRNLDTYLATCRLVMQAELGRDFASWGFVHGNWALNGSNPVYCNIADELAILKRHGCYGDFTFPAGDWRNDPALKTPFTCDPVAAPRGYDRVEATPRPLSRHGGDLNRDRFLIWNSDLDATRSSLDLYQPHLLALLKQPEFILRDWFTKAPVIDGCLYIKTHAHSADRQYALWQEDSIVPHSFTPVLELFELLERVVDRARLPLRVATVSEVVEDLKTFDSPPPLSSPARSTFASSRSPA